MSDGPEVGYFKTASGLVLDLHLPLNENMHHQLTRGELVRCNPDGSTLTVEQGGGPVPKPPANAAKAAWVGYAVSQGMDVNDADALTRNDLVEKFTK
jgi:hypothetical protein